MSRTRNPRSRTTRTRQPRAVTPGSGFVRSLWRFGPLQFALFVCAVLILGTIGIVGIYLRFAAVLISLAACSAKAAVEAVGGRVFGPGMFGSEAESPVSMPLAESYAEER